MFLREVAWATTDATLRDAMRAFGDVVEATVVRDRNTGKSKVKKRTTVCACRRGRCHPVVRVL